MASLKGNISKFFAWIMVSIVIISLAGFGIQDVILGSTGRNIATVGKEKISINFFIEILNLLSQKIPTPPEYGLQRDNVGNICLLYTSDAADE